MTTIEIRWQWERRGDAVVIRESQNGLVRAVPVAIFERGTAAADAAMICRMFNKAQERLEAVAHETL
jgi:hypothetical protein